MKIRDIMADRDYIEGVDYYLEDGRVIFTAKYLKEQGKCCSNNCINCPYGGDTTEKE
jgi:hypothetical protein